MTKTISRDFVSNNFVFADLKENTYDKAALIERISFWKYILVHHYHAVSQESILIGLQKIGVDYFAIILASAELGLKIVVVDYNRIDKFRDLEYNDPKTKLLSPIDIFLHDYTVEALESNPSSYAKYVFFTKHSVRAYSTVDACSISVDVTQRDALANIRPSPADILFKVTSSGTTDIPKVIEHTHEFIYTISLRNSKLYKGTAVHVNNLNHGASASVTLLPLLANDAVDKHLFYDCADYSTIDDFVNTISPYKSQIGFLSFPYPFLIDKFIEVSRQNKIKWPCLDLITLSYILQSAKHAVRDGIFNSVTSIFGSNETLGPLFVNRADNANWDIDSRYFYKYDQFYDISLSHEGKITVVIPIYNKKIVTNDYFEQQGDYYIHHGRSDLFRINGETISLSIVNDLNKRFTQTYIVIDTVNHCLYLACWEDLSVSSLNSIAKEIESNFERVKITKTAHLEKSNFYYGIKIDNELLREHFRTYNV